LCIGFRAYIFDVSGIFSLNQPPFVWIVGGIGVILGV